MLRSAFNSEIIRIVRLNYNSACRASARSARDLLYHGEGHLRSPITALSHHSVRRDNGRQGDAPEIQTARDHLSAYQYISLAVFKLRIYPLMRVLPARRVEIHSQDSRLREQFFYLHLKLLSSHADQPYIRISAIRTDI